MNNNKIDNLLHSFIQGLISEDHEHYIALEELAETIFILQKYEDKLDKVRQVQNNKYMRRLERKILRRIRVLKQVTIEIKTNFIAAHSA